MGEFSGSGLLPARLIISPYDRWWSFFNSRNPDRHDKPDTSLVVVGRNPSLHGDSIVLPPPRPKKFYLCSNDHRERLRAAARKPKKRYSLETSNLEPFIRKGGNHVNLKLMDKSFVDNHLLKIRDLRYLQEEDGGAKYRTLGQLYVDVDKYGDGDEAPWDHQLFLRRHSKVRSGSTEKKKNGSRVNSGDQISQETWIQDSSPGYDNRRESVRFGDDDDDDDDENEELSATDIGFANMRKKMDAAEGFSLRGSIASNVRGSIVHKRGASFVSNRLEVPTGESAGHFSTQDFSSPAKTNPGRGSIMKDRRRSTVRGGSVAFRDNEQIPIRVSSSQSHRNFDMKKKNHIHQEAMPLLVYSSNRKVKDSSVDSEQLLRHENHSSGFERKYQLKIKMDERQEGYMFRLSVAPADDSFENMAVHKTDSKAHVNFQEALQEKTSSQRFKKIYQESIVPHDREEGQVFVNSKKWKIYTFQEGTIGFSRDDVDEGSLQNIRHFSLSRKDAPEDDMALLTCADGRIVGFYSRDSNTSFKSKSSSRSSTETVGEDFHFVYNTKDDIIGFKNKNKMSHEVDFERVRQKRFSKGERDEALVFKLLRHLENSSKIRLDENWPVHAK